MSVIQVFTGPMRCGKSEALLDCYNRSKIAKRNSILFKPIIDTRTPQYITTRKGEQIKAIEVDSLQNIYKYVIAKSDIQDVFIDEFQFFNDSIQYLLHIYDMDINIYTSGLNTTAERIPFGSMPQLLSIATDIKILKAVCECCYNQDAIYTYCKHKKQEQILIGDSEYIPVCAKCYKQLMT